jgi:hypothetical protein
MYFKLICVSAVALKEFNYYIILASSFLGFVYFYELPGRILTVLFQNFWPDLPVATPSSFLRCYQPTKSRKERQQWFDY